MAPSRSCLAEFCIADFRRHRIEDLAIHSDRLVRRLIGEPSETVILDIDHVERLDSVHWASGQILKAIDRPARRRHPVPVSNPKRTDERAHSNNSADHWRLEPDTSSGYRVGDKGRGVRRIIENGARKFFQIV